MLSHQFKLQNIEIKLCTAKASSKANNQSDQPELTGVERLWQIRSSWFSVLAPLAAGQELMSFNQNLWPFVSILYQFWVMLDWQLNHRLHYSLHPLIFFVQICTLLNMLYIICLLYFNKWLTTFLTRSTDQISNWSTDQKQNLVQGVGST